MKDHPIAIARLDDGGKGNSESFCNNKHLDSPSNSSIASRSIAGLTNSRRAKIPKYPTNQ